MILTHHYFKRYQTPQPFGRWMIRQPGRKFSVLLRVSRTTRRLGPTACLLKYSNMVARRCWNACVRCFMRSGIQVVLLNSGRRPILSASIRRKVTGPCAETAEASPFLSTAGKVLARVMLVRLLQCVADECCRSPSAGLDVKC